MTSSAVIPLTGLADDAIRALVQIHIVCANTAFRAMATTKLPGSSCVVAFKTSLTSYMTIMNVENPKETAAHIVRIAVGRIFVGMPLMVIWSDSSAQYRCTLKHNDVHGYYLQSQSFLRTAEVVLFDPTLDEWFIPVEWFEPQSS